MLAVEEALGAFMEAGKAWPCWIVACAHPKEAFREQKGEIPALWLSRQPEFKKQRPHARLLGELTKDERLAALKICCAKSAMARLREIETMMAFRLVWPERCEARARAKGKKARKEIARLLGACESAWLEEALKSAEEGFNEGMRVFAQEVPGAKVWLPEINWSSIPGQALSSAERRALREETLGASGSGLLREKSSARRI